VSARQPGALRRLRGVLLLAFAIALAAGILVTAGATLVARARGPVVPPADGRFFVVAKGPLAEATRASLLTRPEITISAEHSIDQLLGETLNPRSEGESLRVLEVTVPRRPGDDLPETVATLQQLEGVVEVIALDTPAVAAPSALAPHQAIVGGALTIVGCALFVAGLVLAATIAVRESADEIAARYLLGAEPRSLWRPLGVALGVTAVAGALGAVLATGLAAGFLGASPEPLPGTAAAGLAPASRLSLVLATAVFMLGAVGSAALAARRAVLRLAAEPARMMILVLAVLLSAGVASAAPPPSDWQVLRSVAREIAGCRRGLRDAQRELATTERAGLRAYARQDAVLLRLAVVQREQDARVVVHWQESCSSLQARRDDLRLLHRTSLSPEPPIAPRRPPATGGLAVAFGEAGLPGKPHAFRNGVGLRVRPGEVVRAAAAGQVVFAGDLAGSGRVVVISHGRRTFSVYGKVAEALVVRGMQVEAGEPVASAGADPRVIYFSVRERGKPIDPVAWLRDETESAPGG
jgi:murein DD-endopeptidase MepM/ murein hydrolase activator NlpD